jgi:hypothetical protein
MQGHEDINKVYTLEKTLGEYIMIQYLGVLLVL